MIALIGLIAFVVLGVAVAIGLLYGRLELPFTSGRMKGSGAVQLSGVAVYFNWPEFNERVQVDSESELEIVRGLLDGVVTQAGSFDPSSVFWRLDLAWSDGRVTALSVTREYRLFVAAGDSGELPESLKHLGPGEQTGSPVEWVSPELAAWVRAQIEALESQFYGELLTWPEVARHFPVGGTAVVRDLETGRSFQVRRHRGDSHADVEPLTADDSRILQEIYGGEWSWKRRAVVLSIGDLRAAGSMNGMPHGWGDLFENEFVGHSCIHFWQSRVHGTWREDPGHQLKVLKAAGRLTQTLDAASPDELAKWSVAAINHQDVVSLRYMSGQEDALGSEFASAARQGGGFSILLSQLALPIRHISYHGARMVDQEERTATVEVSATVYYHEPDPDRGYLKVVRVRLKRANPGEPWRVDLASLIPMARTTGGVAALSGAPYDAEVAQALSMGCEGHS